MDTQKQSLFATILARLSLGSVPVDGSYWFERRISLQDHRTRGPRPVSGPTPASTPTAQDGLERIRE
jgi:hypothetical protein